MSYGTNPGTGKAFKATHLDKYGAINPQWVQDGFIDAEEWALFQLAKTDAELTEGWAADPANRQKLFDQFASGLDDVSESTREALLGRMSEVYPDMEFKDTFSQGAPEFDQGWYDNITGLMERKGQSWAEAIAHNESALSQRPDGDTNNDGFYSDEEWEAADPLAGVVTPEYGTGTGDGVDGEAGGITGGETSDTDVGTDVIVVDGEQTQVDSGGGWIEGSGVDWGKIWIPDNLRETMSDLVQTIPDNTPDLIAQAAEYGIIPDTPELHEWLKANGVTPDGDPRDPSGTHVNPDGSGTWTNESGETFDPADVMGDTAPDIPDNIHGVIQDLMDGGLTYEEAVAHNDNALNQREGVDADGDGYVTDEEWAAWEDPAVVDDTTDPATDPDASWDYMVDIGNGTMVDIRDVFNPDNEDWNWYEVDGEMVFGPPVEGQDPVDPLGGDTAGDGVAGDGQSTDSSGNPVSAPGGTDIQESEDGTVSVTTSTGSNDGGWPDWLKGVPIFGELFGGDDDDDSNSEGGDGVASEWLKNLFGGDAGKNVLNQAIQFKASDAMGDAYKDAAEDALLWQKELQGKQEPFRNFGQNMLAGLARNTNRWIEMDPREQQLSLDTSATGLQADPRQTLGSYGEGITPDSQQAQRAYNTNPNWVSDPTALHSLDTTPNIRGRMGSEAAGPEAFGGFQGLTDFAGKTGDWGVGTGTPQAGQQNVANSGQTITDPQTTFGVPGGAPVADSPVQQPSQPQSLDRGSDMWNLWMDDAKKLAENRGKARGRWNTQETQDSALKSMMRAGGELEGLKGQRLQQELARRTFDRDTAMGQRQQQVGEQLSQADMAFNQLSRNRDRMFSEMFAEDQTTFDRRLSANQERSDWRNQYFSERAAEDSAKFDRTMAANQQDMANRSQYWQELVGADDSDFRRLQAQNQQDMSQRDQYFREMAAQNEAQFGRSLAANQQQMADRDQYFRELMAQDQQMWGQFFEGARLGQSAASGMATAATNAADIYGAAGAGKAATYENWASQFNEWLNPRPPTTIVT